MLLISHLKCKELFVVEHRFRFLDEIKVAGGCSDRLVVSEIISIVFACKLSQKRSITIK